MGGWASDGSNQWVPVAVDPATGAILTEGSYVAGSVVPTPGGEVAFGQYSTSTPSLTTNGTLSPLQVDGSSRLFVNIAPLVSSTDSIAAVQSGAWTAAATQSGAWNTGTASRAPSTGQTNLAASATGLNAGSIASTNGIIVRAMSANAAKVYIGASGVSTSTGYELSPGEQVVFTAANINVLYGISTNGTDDVCWSVT
jgi:hypothetical protein